MLLLCVFKSVSVGLFTLQPIIILTYLNPGWGGKRERNFFFFLLLYCLAAVNFYPRATRNVGWTMCVCVW